MSPAAEIQIVSPDVLFWSAYAPEVKADLSACAVRGSAGWVVVDPIALIDDAWEELLGLAKPLAIVLTNGNHARAAEDFRERLGIPVLAHPEAKADLGIEVDEDLSEAAAVAGDLQVIELPGAGAGEIALFAPDRSLHLGDALINPESPGFTFLPDKYCRDPKKLRESLRRLLPLRFSLATFAHGLPIVSGASQKVSRLLS
jgi:glyoxylase-like metal-dependent hydrolase (beta-lactamase superfamily II)